MLTTTRTSSTPDGGSSTRSETAKDSCQNRAAEDRLLQAARRLAEVVGRSKWIKCSIRVSRRRQTLPIMQDDTDRLQETGIPDQQR